MDISKRDSLGVENKGQHSANWLSHLICSRPVNDLSSSFTGRVDDLDEEEEHLHSRKFIESPLFKVSRSSVSSLNGVFSNPLEISSDKSNFPSVSLNTPDTLSFSKPEIVISEPIVLSNLDLASYIEPKAEDELLFPMDQSNEGGNKKIIQFTEAFMNTKLGQTWFFTKSKDTLEAEARYKKAFDSNDSSLSRDARNFLDEGRKINFFAPQNL